jgi:GWxTD domain-containing protein
VQRSIENRTDGLRRVVVSHTFKQKLGVNGEATILFTDQNRNWYDVQRIPFVKSDTISNQDFLIIDNRNGSPIFGSSIAEAMSVSLDCPRCKADVYISYWQPEAKLPPPPYSEAKVSTPDLRLSPQTTITDSSILVKPGVYSVHLASDYIFSFFGRNASFPDIKTVSAMGASMRYISSTKEHDRIMNSKQPKYELDRFWLDCGGSKDSARELIKNYYRRVIEANMYFSSFVEGWQTDRGLIHIVFGNPNKIKKGTNGEQWIYGEENNVSSIIFNFSKVNTPYSDNEFHLQRNPLYRAYFDQAVSAWRNGRIFMD